MPTGIYERTPEMRANMSVASRNSEAVKAYHDSQIGVSRSPEACATMSVARRNSDAVKAKNEAMIGVLHSPERIAAIIEGQEKAGVFDAQRGGNDMVNHHYLYDDADLSKYTMPMTRSEHTAMHWRMREDGYEVPHINSKTDDNILWGYN